MPYLSKLKGEGKNFMVSKVQETVRKHLERQSSRSLLPVGALGIKIF